MTMANRLSDIRIKRTSSGTTVKRMVWAATARENRVAKTVALRRAMVTIHIAA
jgi:hypothetical protein